MSQANENILTLRSMKSILVILTLMGSSVSLLISINDRGVLGYKGPTREEFPTINGDLSSYEISYTDIVGEHQSDIGGKLGKNIGKSDVNGDGWQDLYISAPHLTGVPGTQNTGKCYIWYGNRTLDKGTIDLSIDDPDIVIRGSSTDSQIAGVIEAGDIDNDGNIDMIIGNPVQPESGKVYILWGKNGDWPDIINLYQAAGDEPNDFPVGFLNTNDYTVISGEVTTNALGTHLGKNIAVEDLDDDGYDDVVFSFHGWNSVLVGWGGPDRLSFGDELTYIKENTEVARFGFDLELGDLDNDGNLDMVVSAPIQSDETRSVFKAGSINVYYSIGRIKGNTSVSSSTYLRPKIWGFDPYDNLGFEIELCDIDGDGRDDILVGVPGSDGPKDSRLNSGMIMLIRGKNISSFPTSVIGEDIAEKLIHGYRGESGDVQGFELGRKFVLGDIDGNNVTDLLVSSPIEKRDGSTIVGMTSIYDHNEVFSPINKDIDLGVTEPRIVIWGSDQEDSFGSSLVTIDLNNDGAEEMIISSPNGDGHDNQRQSCGEVHIIMGNTVSIEDISFDGNGVNDGVIYSGLGMVTIEFMVRRYPEIGAPQEIRMTLDPEGTNITLLILQDGNITKQNDIHDTIQLDEDGTGLEGSGNWGTVTFSFGTSILFDVDQGSEIMVVFKDGYGRSSFRSFNEKLFIERDFELKNDVVLLRNGIETNSPNEWFSPDDTITFAGGGIVYADGKNIMYKGDELSVYLEYENGSRVYNSIQTELMIESPVKEKAEVFKLGIEVIDSIIPVGYPRDSLPGLGDHLVYSPRIDDDEPDRPMGITTYPEESSPSIYDDDTEWYIGVKNSIGDELDRNGSGVKKFEYSVNGSSWKDFRESGGLWATYYRGREFNELVEEIEGIDRTVNHPISEWNGFSPFDDKLVHDNFSIRYHGWFSAIESREHVFSLSGGGEGRLSVDGETQIGWSDLSSTPLTDPLFIEAGEEVEIIIHMKCAPQYSGISFKVRDEFGMMVPVDGDQLIYPSNKTRVDITMKDRTSIRARSVDWTEHISTATSTSVYMDSEGPRFDISTISRWYPSTEPTLRFSIQDPKIGNVNGSGIDTEKIQYRLRQRGNESFSEWKNITLFEDMIDGNEGPVSLTALFKIQLIEEWQGVIQFKATDIVGNEELSSLVDVGIDMEGPSFEVLQPNLLLTQEEGDIEIMVKATDRPGAGVDGSQIEMRISGPETTSTMWYPMNGSGISEESVAVMQFFFVEGEYEISFRATDAIGNTAFSDPYTMTVKEKIVDLAPVPVISSPFEGEEFREGMPVLLDSEGTSDDGNGRYDSLKFTWFSNRSGLLGTGRSRSVYLDEMGYHRITLYVDDGTMGHNISAYVNITMVPLESNGTTSGDINETDDGDLLTILVIATAIVVIMGIMMIFAIVRYRKQKEEEIQIMYREKTADEDSYEDRIRREEMEMGLVNEREISEEKMRKQSEDLYGSFED